MKSIFKIELFQSIFVVLFIRCEKEPDQIDPADIPDQYFLDTLREDGADKNEDGVISYGEAQLVKTIYLDPKSASTSKGKIASLEGIEAFVNLDTLHCCFNQVRQLDVSN